MFALAGPGEGSVPHPPPPALFIDQNEARRAEKNIFGDWPPPLISGSG